MDLLTAQVLQAHGSRFVEIVAEAFDLGAATRLPNGSGWVYRNESETEYGGHPDRMTPPFALSIDKLHTITIWLPEVAVMISEPKPGQLAIAFSRASLDRSLCLGLARLERMTGQVMAALPLAYEATRA